MQLMYWRGVVNLARSQTYHTFAVLQCVARGLSATADQRRRNLVLFRRCDQSCFANKNLEIHYSTLHCVLVELETFVISASLQKQSQIYFHDNFIDCVRVFGRPFIKRSTLS